MHRRRHRALLGGVSSDRLARTDGCLTPHAATLVRLLVCATSASLAKTAEWTTFAEGVGTVERAEVIVSARRLGRVRVAKGASGNFAVLRNRDFRLLFSGQLVSVFGDRMVSVALAFAVLGIGGSASDVGFVLAADVVALVAGVLIGGVVADRNSRRRVMVASDLVRLASQGTVATLLITGAAHIWMLAVLAGVAGVGTGFFNPASTGLLPAIVPAAELQSANALRYSAMSVGQILGPVAAGVLVAGVGAGWTFAADAATFAVSAACLMRLRPPTRAPAKASTFLADVREGWAAFMSRRWVWTVVSYFAMSNIVWGAWLVLGPVIAFHNLGGAAAWGTVLAGAGVGTLLGSLLATQVKPRRPLVFVALADGLIALPLGSLAAAASVPLLFAAALLSGAGMTLGLTVWESTLQQHVPGESLSRVSSYDWFGSLVFAPVGLVIWAPIAALTSSNDALWAAFAIAVAIVIALLAVPDTRQLSVNRGHEHDGDGSSGPPVSTASC
jgi:MFS family permease